MCGAATDNPAGLAKADPAPEPAAEIAALRRELERLRESEKMYCVAAEVAGCMVWSAEPAGRLDAMSQVFQALTGQEPAASLGWGWLDFVHPDDRARAEQAWRKSVATGEAFCAEFRALLKDGQVRWVLSKALAIRDREGKITHWYGSTTDIHDERAAERARREVEERYRLAVQATNDAVWDYDIAAGTVDWSDNSAEIFRFDAPLGRTSIGWWEDRIHPDDRSRIVRALAEAIDTAETHWTGTYRFLRNDGSYAEMLDRGFLIRDESGRIVRAVGAMADLTERKRAEADLQRMQDELIHVSRLSAMGAMAATLAHELNQPLAAVTNFISGAKRHAERADDLPGGLSEALDLSASAAQRAGEIVRRLRDLVSRGTVSVAAQPLPQLIEEASVLAFVDARQLGIAHRHELDPAAQWVMADRIQIQQVLINLIRNAIEAMAKCKAREVLISSRRVGRMVEISVADTGPGIAPEHKDSLFSQFMTTKSGGMGIGLPISRTIVELHGGTIWAENRPGGGAVFRFTLPKASPRKSRQG